MTEIRCAHPGDLDGLVHIWTEFMRTHAERDPAFTLAPNAPEIWRRAAAETLSHSERFTLVALPEPGAIPVGFCTGFVAANPDIYRVSRVGFLSEVAVARSHHRRGHGATLVYEAIRWFKGRGLSEFQLSTAVWNEAAQALWKRMGGEPHLARYRFAL